MPLEPKKMALGLALLQGLWGCNRLDPHLAFVAPDQSRWVAISQLAPDPDQDRLLPTQRLTLCSRWAWGGKVVLEGLETLCGTQVTWKDSEHLTLRLAPDRAWSLKVKDGESWGGVQIQVLLHEDQVKWDLWNTAHDRRLVVIQDCESEAWNVYLRRSGDATYNERMKDGWDDPALLGGFGWEQPALGLRWTSLREARIEVPGKRYNVTLRDQAGDVKVKWVFLKHAKAPPEHFQTLAPAKR